MAIFSNMRLLIFITIFIFLTLSHAVRGEEPEVSGEPDLTSEEIGYLLAEINCARCHQIDLQGESPHKKAPPFWQMSEIITSDKIVGTLLLGLSPDHSDMPVFDISLEQAEYIFRWIEWVKPTAYGKRLVEQYCSECHAVEIDDMSAHREAPPFRNLSMFFPIKTLEKKFSNGISVPHPHMPDFIVDDILLHNMMKYIGSLQNPKQ